MTPQDADTPESITGVMHGPSGPPTDVDDAVDLDPLTRTLLHLKRHIEAAEAIDWTLVPDVSVAEAGAWTRKCDLAREELARDADCDAADVDQREGA